MIALCIILKHTEPFDFVARCLYSVAKYVDAIYLTINAPFEKETPEAKDLKKKIEVLCLTRSYPPVHFSYTKWEKDFSKARNFNFSQVPKEYDYIFWLDADDILLHGENLRNIYDLAKKNDFGAVFFNYLYRVDMDKKTNKIRQVLIEHLRERLIRNDGSYKWIAPVHETLIEQRQTNKTDSKDCVVLHLSDDERARGAIDRNIEILEKQLEGQGKSKDPRTMHYLAKSYFDLRTDEYWNKAEKLFLNYVNGSEENVPSGWNEERGQAYEYLAEIYRGRGHINKAIKATANALIEAPKFPNFYITMALNYAYAQDWEKAKHWAKLSQQVPYPRTTLVLNPRDMQARVLEVLFNVGMKENNIDEAWATSVKLAELFPEEPPILERLANVTELRKQNDIAIKLIQVAKYLYETKQMDKLTALVKAIPDTMAETPIMQSLRRDVMPAVRWADNDICIVCGKGFEQWSPKSLVKGIGGSEEAVIYLSRELTKLGWRVTVYADPQQDKGFHDGVGYRPYYEFNQKDNFNILIFWRNIGVFDNIWKSKRTYLWCHDVLNPQEFTSKRLDGIERIMVLSKFHRNLIPNVPDNKIIVSANGLTLPENLLKTVKRDLHKIFSGSSYDRGLEHLLKMWPEILKEVPDATLEICYGWNLFDSFYSNNPERMAWKAKMVELMEQKGITHHGRVGHPELENIMLGCGIWAYSSHFEEISCITAMRAQMLGCIPVVTDYAALKETVLNGVKVSGDIYEPEVKEAFKKELIKALKDEKWQESIRPEMMKVAKDKFGWDMVAKNWDIEFKRDGLKEAMDIILTHNKNVERFMPISLQVKYDRKQTY